MSTFIHSESVNKLQANLLNNFIILHSPTLTLSKSKKQQLQNQYYRKFLRKNIN